MALAARNDHVEVTGGVEDIRAYVRDASVYVVPLRIGGGTRLKIFEAMAMGKAVVATSVGAEGLPVEHGKDIILADDPAEFAEAVSALLANPAAREKLGKAGRSLVEENYSWASAAARLEIVLVRTAKKNSSRAGSP
jgi:glycosyltransferase involved in cell wall biosynthesis